MESTPTPAWADWRGALALAAALLTAPLASAGQAELATAIGETRNEVVATRDQLQVTVDTLDALVKQKEGDLKPAYAAFATQVARAQTDAAVTRARTIKMQNEAKAHFGGWQTEVDSINNPKLRKQGQKRLDSVQQNYGKVVTQLANAGASFAPYLSDLADINKILSNDLTPGGIKAVRGTVSKAKFDLQGVRRHIFDAVKTLDSMQTSLSSSASK